MNSLDPHVIEEFAQRYGVSHEAVNTLLEAIIAGHGTMAQFSHPELGGLGQWSQSGMTMIGDMFNDALRAKVNGLCSDLASLLRRDSSSTRSESNPPQMHRQGVSDGEVSLHVPAKGGSLEAWWGIDLGRATATGSQNDIRYAYFSTSRRLAIRIGPHVTIYDTDDHDIRGISQRQSGDASLTFISQRGLIRLAELRIVSQ